MIVKNGNFELEISIGTDVYFGSKASGQNLKNGMMSQIMKNLD